MKTSFLFEEFTIVRAACQSYFPELHADRLYKVQVRDDFLTSILSPCLLDMLNWLLPSAAGLAWDAPSFSARWSYSSLPILSNDCWSPDIVWWWLDDTSFARHRGRDEQTQAKACGIFHGACVPPRESGQDSLGYAAPWKAHLRLSWKRVQPWTWQTRRKDEARRYVSCSSERRVGLSTLSMPICAVSRRQFITSSAAT